jgi:hypothetical protein
MTGIDNTKQRARSPHALGIAALRLVTATTFLPAVMSVTAGVSAAASSPDAATIVGRMKLALEPAQSSLRRVTLAVSQDGETRELTLGEARGKAGDESHILVVVLAPADLRGTAFLVR